MNIESMEVRSYRSIAADEHVPAQAAERYRTLKACENLRAAGCSEEGALEQLGISRRTKSTRPRRVRQRAWKPRDVKAVMDVRRKYPFMGKARIHAMLARKGGHLSVSTVGRIIERALAAGAIRPDRTGRPRRSATGFSPRAGQAQAAAQLREVGEALAVRLQGPQAGGTRADRPHDLRVRRTDAEGVREPKVRRPSVRCPGSW